MIIFPQTQVPLTVPSCVGWMDAADLSTITSSGGSVSSVRNKANSLIPFVQATGAKQPITGTRTINGLNVLDFDGTSDRLGANGLAAYFTTGTAPFTTFVVGYTDTITGGSRGVWGSSFATSRYLSCFRKNASAIAEIGSQNDVGGFRDVNSTNPLVVATPFVFTNVYDGANVSNYQDAATINTAQAFANGTVTLDTFSVGSITSVSNYWDGVIAEFILYNRAVSSAERVSIERYLGNKWGIVIS